MWFIELLIWVITIPNQFTDLCQSLDFDSFEIRHEIKLVDKISLMYNHLKYSSSGRSHALKVSYQ